MLEFPFPKASVLKILQGRRSLQEITKLSSKCMAQSPTSCDTKPFILTINANQKLCTYNMFETHLHKKREQLDHIFLLISFGQTLNIFLLFYLPEENDRSLQSCSKVKGGMSVSFTGSSFSKITDDTISSACSF